MSIKDIVVVNITKETKAVTKKGFGVPLILGNHTKWNGVKQVHTLVFSGDLIASNAVNGNVSGAAITEVDYDTSHEDTLTAVAAAIQANATVLSAVSNGTDTITVTSIAYEDIELTGFLVTGGAGQETIVATETVEQADEIRTYTSLTAVADDFATSDAEYKKASALFSQPLKPEKIKIGRRRSALAQVANIEVASVSDDTEYKVILNGTEYSFTSGVSATANDIVDGLVSAINGGSDPVTPSDNGDNFDLTADTPGQSFDVTVTTNLTFTTTTNNKGMADDISRAEQVDPAWYFLIITTSLDLDILEAAKSIESSIKLFFYETNSADVKNNVANNIAAQVSAKGYDRTVQVYISTSTDEADAAWVGGQAPKSPGSITWKFKTLKGVTVDDLTSTEKANLEANNVNYYTPIGGQSIMQQGVCSSGEFIDIMRGTDWIHARIEENVYAALVNQDKIPFTNAGIDVIKSKIKQILLKAVGLGILVDEPARPLKVSAPDITLISANDKTTRLLQNVTFEGFYAGAIHKVKIQGYLNI